MLIPSSTSADVVSFTPAGTIAATTVQAGMEEINTDLSSTYATIASLGEAGYNPFLLPGL